MFSGGAREISIAVRDGLLLLEQQNAQQPATLIEELEQEAAASLRAVQNLIDGMYSLARWREIQEVFDAFEQWLQTPLAECGLPPLVVVSRRGNPAEPAPEEPAA